MPMATDKEEKKMKQVGAFLDKFQDEDKVILRSNLYWLISHYLEAQSTSVICTKKEDCPFCQGGNQPRKEYYYIVDVYHKGDDEPERGIAGVPASVFYEMSSNERLLKKSKREFEWVIGKTGEGKKTRYSTIRGKDIKVDEEEIEKNNKMLATRMDSYSKNLEERGKEQLKSFGETSEDIINDEGN